MKSFTFSLITTASLLTTALLVACRPGQGASTSVPSVTFRAERLDDGAATPRGSESLLQVESVGEAAQPAPDARILWCVSGGAPVVGLPVIDAENRAYVATSDGYLHAFERDGRYRWSYTVKGTPLGSVSLRASDGLILLGTTNKLVYAISQRGTLYWSFSTVTPVWSGLFALNERSVVFVGLDERLYALSNSGHAQYRVRAPGTPMGGPVVAPKDVVWLALSAGVARFHAAYQLEHFPLPSAVEQLVTWKDGAVAVAAGTAYWLRAGRQAEALGEASYVASDGARLLVGNDAGLSLYSEPGASPRELGSHAGEMSAAPVLMEQAVWLPGVDGSMRLVSLDDGAVDEIKVSAQKMKTPVVSGTGDYAIFTDAVGRFCAFDPARSTKFEKH